MKNISLFRKKDILIIAVLFVVGIAGILLPKLLKGNVIAEISFNGIVVKQVDLSKNTSFTLHNMDFEVKDHSIRVVHSPCHDKICVRTGFISSPAQTIVCVPERLVVKIISSENDIDLIIG